MSEIIPATDPVEEDGMVEDEPLEGIKDELPSQFDPATPGEYGEGWVG